LARDASGQPLWQDDDEPRPHTLIVTTTTTVYGIPVAQVREVLRPTAIVRVPGAAACTVGIVNVRGAIVTVLDLAALMTGERAVTTGSIVLLEYGTRLIGLAVQAVRDVREEHPADALVSDTPMDHEVVVPLDAVALCARHLLSSAEMTQ
jgi:purine-binding chemotaxis protein CheW